MRKPRVAVISTGDELISPAEKPAPGQIRDVNSPLLYSAVLEAGGEPHQLGFIRDNEDAITETLRNAVVEH